MTTENSKTSTPIHPTNGIASVWVVSIARPGHPVKVRLFPTRDMADGYLTVSMVDLAQAAKTEAERRDFDAIEVQHFETSFLSDVMVTDTRVWEVVGVTDKTIKVRPCGHGKVLQSEHRDGNPYPVVWAEAYPDPFARTKIVRRRGDGTFRIHGGQPLRAATIIDGKPVSYTDYRW